MYFRAANNRSEQLPCNVTERVASIGKRPVNEAKWIFVSVCNIQTVFRCTELVRVAQLNEQTNDTTNNDQIRQIAYNLINWSETNRKLFLHSNSIVRGCESHWMEKKSSRKGIFLCENCTTLNHGDVGTRSAHYVSWWHLTYCKECRSFTLCQLHLFHSLYFFHSVYSCA